jgi:hypothetical protein
MPRISFVWFTVRQTSKISSPPDSSVEMIRAAIYERTMKTLGRTC